MTVLSGQTIAARGIILPRLPRGEAHGTTYGLGPAGYDVRLDLEEAQPDTFVVLYPGKFLLASTIETFNMPRDVLGVVHDKSTWCRRGVSVFNTVIEPGWRGFLTLEIKNHGPDPVRLDHGAGIAQIVFHLTDEPTHGYTGKYQDQPRGPVPAR